MEISQVTDEIIADKNSCIVAAGKILSHYNCSASAEGIGDAIDKWKVSKDILEQEMIDCLGFMLGDLCISNFGGEWVIVSL